MRFPDTVQRLNTFYLILIWTPSSDCSRKNLPFGDRVRMMLCWTIWWDKCMSCSVSPSFSSDELISFSTEKSRCCTSHHFEGKSRSQKRCKAGFQQISTRNNWCTRSVFRYLSIIVNIYLYFGSYSCRCRVKNKKDLFLWRPRIQNSET